MGRPGHSLFASAVLLAALVCFGAVSGRAAPPSRAPASPAAAVNIKVEGVAYTDARVFLGRHGYKPVWVERGKTMRFQSAASRIDMEADKRDTVFNGMRILMGDPAIHHGGSLYISRIDADRLFLPILNAGAVTAPAAPALRVIVLDPGHGGSDTGTQNKSLKLDEKTFTLDVAIRLKALLAKQGYKVVMTRTDDRFVPLPQRAEIANKAGADLFISIHFNAVGGGSLVRGTETYVMTPQTQRSTGSAKRDASDNEAHPGNLNDPWNALLGYHMHRGMLEKLGSADRGLKRARFAVLRLVKSPGVLVEAGYLSNEAEAKKIATPAYRQDIAESLAQGVRAYAHALAAAKAR